MFEGSKRRFGITSNLSGLSHGIVVNDISVNDYLESAQALDSKGKIIDIAVYNEENQVSIDGLYIDQGVEAGTVIKVDDKSYLVTSTEHREDNTTFQTASVYAIAMSGEIPPTPPQPPIDYTPLMFRSVDDEGTYIQLKRFNAGSLEAINLVYRKNNGLWTTYNIGDILALNKGDVVFLSGVNDHFSKDSNNFYYFTIDGKVEASGNIMSLMNFSDTCTSACFNCLFIECDDLLTAPNLSATTLAPNCYDSMFKGCRSLSSAPQLSVTTLADSCYFAMFMSCQSLTDAPQLPATSLVHQCYRDMFKGCTILSSITVSFTEWDQNITSMWVDGVQTNNGVFTKPEALSTIYGIDYIPTNWQVVPDDPINAPLTFKGLSSTNYVQLSAVGNPRSIVLDYKINDGNWTTYTTGTVITLNEGDTVAFSGANNDHFNTGYYSPYYNFRMSGLVEADGNIMSLMNFSENCTEGCFFALFNECSSLVTPPLLPATGLAFQCYEWLFRYCTNLSTAPELPATQMQAYCYTGMFSYCDSLLDAPYLPAPTSGLYSQCYSYMFYGSKNLSSINVPFTQWDYTGELWVSGVATTGIFTKPDQLEERYSTSYIPPGWRVVNTGNLTFTALDDDCVISLQKYGSPYNNSFQYNKNENGWVDYNLGDMIIIDKDETVSFKGLSGQLNQNQNNRYSFSTSGPLKISGSINHLINDYPSAKFMHLFSNTSLVDASKLYISYNLMTNSFQNTFGGCSNLTAAPAKLPATSLKDYCYEYMFNNCTSLKRAPYLYASSFKTGCYMWMFSHCQSLTAAATISPYHDYDTVSPYCFTYMYNGCSSLVSVPSNYLPATGLASSCYYAMFSDCDSLLDAPELPATKLKDSCYEDMFKGCKNLTSAPALPATSLAVDCYRGMFYDCPSLSTAPELPATTLAEHCYEGMFGFTYLTSAPALPATSLVDYCYYYMFHGCTNINSISVDFTDWTGANLATYAWLDSVPSGGIFYKPTALSAEYGIDRIPTNWQVVNKDQPFDPTIPLTFKAVSNTANVQLYKDNAPPVIVLDYKINDGAWTTYNVGDIINLNKNDTVAFSGNNQTLYAPAANNYHFAMTGTIEADGNIQSLLNYSYKVSRYDFFKLFYDCSSLITAPHLPATSLASGCYQSMFAGCSNLKTAPELPASTLADWCYCSMFWDCPSLTAGPSILPATTLADSCYRTMFGYCSSLIKVPALPASTLAPHCYWGMFEYCSHLTGAPELPATTLANNCYLDMFYSCTRLSSINVSFNSWYGVADPTYDWLKYTSSTGTFTCPTTLGTNQTIDRGADKCPDNWTVVNK